MLVTHTLMQHIEDAIAAERSAFAEGMAALLPASGARWYPIAGGRAIFTGAEYFGNRAMALGFHTPISPADLDVVEAFYAQHGVPAVIELASMADRSLIRLLKQRGYGLGRFRNIYAQALPHRPDTAPQVTAPATVVDIQTVGASNVSAWSLTLLDGFGYTSEAERTRVASWNQMIRTRPGVTPLLAVHNSHPAGAASVMLLGTTALLGGAATLPAFRRQGIQRALIEARLAVATHAGCELAIMTADPGSSSGRNAERTGFQLIGNHVDMHAPAERC